MTEALGVFCLAGSLEYLWSQMMASRDDGLILRAVVWNGLLDLVGTMTIWYLVDEPWYIVPSLAGGALGLAIGMYKTKTPRPSQEDPGG